jgi:hypothetical protein
MLATRFMEFIVGWFLDAELFKSGGQLLQSSRESFVVHDQTM